MTQTGGLVILYAWAIFGSLLAVLAYFLLRHEQDPLEDLSHPSDDAWPAAHSTPANQPTSD
jgi:hypothetical protein